jgi:HPt (histidine-containing phosphotransfer) domain-containing protein
LTEPTVDRPTFRTLQESAGADFVVELVDAFVDEAPRMLAALRDSLAAGDVDGFRRAAHSLKSNSLTFGATALGAQARALELDAPGVVARADVAPIAAVEAELGRALAELSELRHA